MSISVVPIHARRARWVTGLMWEQREKERERERKRVRESVCVTSGLLLLASSGVENSGLAGERVLGRREEQQALGGEVLAFVAAGRGEQLEHRWSRCNLDGEMKRFGRERKVDRGGRKRANSYHHRRRSPPRRQNPRWVQSRRARARPCRTGCGHLGTEEKQHQGKWEAK